MSYNKNTVNYSHIDNTIEVLNDLNVSYTVSDLGKVLARGANDDIHNIKTHTMRELRYKDFIVLERMSRDPDCDSDDIILSYKFNISEFETMMQRDEWKIEHNPDS